MSRFAGTLLLMLLALLPAVAHAYSFPPANTLNTVAGLGTAGFSGDGGPANAAELNLPGGLARLADGSILIADTGNNRVRKLSTAGVITTVAGTGGAATSGDNGPATDAELNLPQDVEVAPDGVTWYIAERGGNVIRRVNAAGTITTVAGTGAAGSGGDLGDAGDAELNGPYGIGIAANGDVFIADTVNNLVRQVVAQPNGLISAASTIVTVAGTGVAGATGDDGPAALARLSAPLDVLPTANFGLLIADNANYRIRTVDGNGNIHLWLGGASCSATYTCGDGGHYSFAKVYRPSSLASDGAGGVLLSDWAQHRVRQVDASGRIDTVIGSGVSCGGIYLCGDGGRAEIGLIWSPYGVLAGDDGTIYVADTSGNKIRARVLNPRATGPAGAPGPQGAAGPDGSVGPDGAAGNAGPAGRDGVSGRSGAGGAAGAAGSPGAAGAAGLQGSSGRRGSPAERIPAMVAMPNSRVIWPAGRRVRMRVFVSSGLELSATANADGAVVRRGRVFKRRGLKQLDFGRLGRGCYRVVVKAVTADGDTATDRITLTVR